MDHRQPDSDFRPAPGLATAPQPAFAGPPPPRDRFPLSASRGLIGVLVATVATFGLVLLVAVVFSIGGSGDLDDNYAFAFVATAVGDLALVLAAIGLTADRGRPTARMFGFRSFRPSAIGWVVLAFIAYLVLAAVYTQLVDPPPDDLPDQLGADESTFLAVVTGVFVIAVAPLVEEFFFRGFLFQALRNSWGPLLAALGSAVIFSGIHLEPDKFVQLAILGLALAFLFQKTGSIWPCIMLHGINNVIAFAVTV